MLSLTKTFLIPMKRYVGLVCIRGEENVSVCSFGLFLGVVLFGWGLGLCFRRFRGKMTMSPDVLVHSVVPRSR